MAQEPRRVSREPQHLDLLLQARHPSVRPDLRGVNLQGLNLQGVRLHRARLDGASLSLASSRASDFHLASFVKADLGAADFSYTDLSGADMRQVLLQEALLTDADLSRADMRESILTGCALNRATLHGTKLSGALIWGTSVWDVQYVSSMNQKGLLIGWDGLDPIDVAMSLENEGKLRMPERSLVVDDLRVAHFMSIIRENEHLAELFDAASSRMVLLLGRLSGDQAAILEALSRVLPRYGYAPVVFDFREPRDRDLTDPRSTLLESQLTIPQIAIPWAPIIRSG